MLLEYPVSGVAKLRLDCVVAIVASWCVCEKLLIVFELSSELSSVLLGGFFLFWRVVHCRVCL